MACSPCGALLAVLRGAPWESSRASLLPKSLILLDLPRLTFIGQTAYLRSASIRKIAWGDNDVLSYTVCRPGGVLLADDVG